MRIGPARVDHARGRSSYCWKVTVEISEPQEVVNASLKLFPLKETLQRYAPFCETCTPLTVVATPAGATPVTLTVSATPTCTEQAASEYRRNVAVSAGDPPARIPVTFSVSCRIARWTVLPAGVAFASSFVIEQAALSPRATVIWLPT